MSFIISLLLLCSIASFLFGYLVDGYALLITGLIVAATQYFFIKFTQYLQDKQFADDKNDPAIKLHIEDKK